MKFIVNADDFGYTFGVNLGIIEGHVKGIITSTTALVGMPAINQAVELSRKFPDLGVGLHLNLTLGKPLTHGPTLTQENGNFVDKFDRFNKPLSIEEVEFELKAQLSRFVELFGKLPTHLDSHHSIHDHPLIWLITQKLAQDNNLPIRRYCNFKWLSSFCEPNNKASDLVKIISELDQDSELMVHPAFCDPDLWIGSSYNIQRVAELTALIDPTVRKAIVDYGIELTNFGETNKVTQ